MAGNSGFIGYVPPSSTDASSTVIIDIAESLDISGFTPHLTVSAIPPVEVSGLVDVSGTSLDNILAKVILSNTALDTIATNVLTASAVSIGGTVTTAAPINQNVSGISLDAIKVATEAIQTDSAANEVLLTAIDTVLDTIKVDTEAIETATEAIQVDAAAIEVLLTNANTDHAANEVLLTAIDAVLDTIKVDTEAIETAVESSVANAGNVLTLKRNVIAPVTGLDVNLKPSILSYLSHVYIDLDATGDNPATNTEVVAAPGSDNKLVIYGVQGSIVGSAAAAAGNWYLSDGNTSAATTLWTGRAQGITNTQFELTFPYGVALTANTALKVTSTEAANHIFINAVVYYRTEAV